MKTLLQVAVALMAFGSALAATNAPAAPPKGGAASFVDTCRVDYSQPKVTLSGRVTDQSETPLQSAVIALRCGTFRVGAVTTKDGAFSVTAPAGNYQLDVDLPGFSASSEMVKLVSGPNQHSVKLEPGQYASIVTVKAPTGFVATTSPTATKTEAPLVETPASVSVVTTDQMAVRNVQTVNEAIQYTGSVAVDTFGAEPRYDWVYIRGFEQSTYGLFRDSSRWQLGNVSGQVDPYLLQEVDIVKGPSSVLFGQIAPGGLINLVTKRPPATTQNEVVLNYGSYSRKQAQLDLGGPVSDTVRYRLTGLVRNSDTQVDYVGDDRWFVAPAITWTPSADTTWTLLGDFQHDKTGWSQFLPSQGTLTSNPYGTVARNFFTGEPNYDYFNRDQWSVGSLFEHRIGSNWSIRNTIRYSKIKFDGKTVFAGGLQEDLRTLTRFAFANTFDLGLFTMDTNAAYHSKSGSVEHNVLIGVDYTDATQKVRSGFAGAPSLDIFAPVYGQGTIGDLFYYQDTEQPISMVGVYAQDHIKIGNSWIVNASLRNDWTSMKTKNNLAPGSPDQEQSPSKATGRLGFAYLTEGGLAPYASYSTSFVPTAGVDWEGKAFIPTTGNQIEAGLKFQPKHTSAFLTAAVFQIEQANKLDADPDHQYQQIQNRDVRARGFEFEAAGSIVPGLNGQATYSYIKEEYTKATDPTLIGNRPPQVPKQLFSASLEYTFATGALRGFGIGGGVRYVGESAGNDTNTLMVPSATLFDAFARYVTGPLEFQVSAVNVTDKTYVAVCQSVNYCNYGSARKVLATVRYRWRNW